MYRPRNPQATDYYRCVEDHLETFIQVYEERFERTYGFFRPYLLNVIYRYLDCGNLHNGFARVKCKDCGHEYLLAYSCKRRHFCPSCHQKRVVEFGECSNVSRGKRQMAGNGDAVPSIIESQGDEKTFRRNWARLIQKIYDVNPLICPKCRGNMRIISSIEEPSVIQAILDHLGIWLIRSRPPLKIHDPPIREYADDFYSDPITPGINTSNHNAS